MTFHPREGRSAGNPRSAFTRRDLLRGAAGIGTLAGLSPLLAACGGGAAASSTSSGGAASGLPRPNNPVTWPINASNKPIASGLSPETGATLKVYNWVAYINAAVVKNFEKAYNCKVEVTTFNTMDEALAKLQSGAVEFDVFVPTLDTLGPLVETNIIQPLNHSYIPNISNAWKEFLNPFYDQKWQYTVPYTIYTTGIAWRKDHVSGSPAATANPWAFPWQSQYKGKVAILDDYREGLSLGLLKNGVTDLNTSDPKALTASQQQLLNLDKLVNLHIDNNDYTNIPSGQIWIHHAWSGDIAAAPSYMPKGVPVDVVGYWFPADGRGPINNDTLAVLKGAKNPVLAHLFLNYLLNVHNALENISWLAYMQPLTAITPERLIQEKILPRSLTSTAVTESMFTTGLRQLQLTATDRALWQKDWFTVSHGV